MKCGTFWNGKRCKVERWTPIFKSLTTEIFYLKQTNKIRKIHKSKSSSAPHFHRVVEVAGCQKRRRRVKCEGMNIAAVHRKSRYTSHSRVVEEVAPRENACPQSVVITHRAFAFQAKQLSSKDHAQSPSYNQQQPALRSYTALHRVQCAELKRNAITTAEIVLQLLQGALKPVQERGARYQGADELRL